MIFLAILSILTPNVNARIDIFDYNCTTFNGTENVYSESAVNCQNLMSDAYCNVAYPSPDGYSPPPAAGNDAPRPMMCYTLGTATPAPISHDAQAAAVATCPRSCGFCCLTSAYKCLNSYAPRVNCQTVSRAQCQSPIWRQILAEDCPATCGFCDLNGCIDLVVACENDTSICTTPGMEDFVNQYCRRTCNRCSSSPCGGK